MMSASWHAAHLRWTSQHSKLSKGVKPTKNVVLRTSWYIWDFSWEKKILPPFRTLAMLLRSLTRLSLRALMLSASGLFSVKTAWRLKATDDFDGTNLFISSSLCKESESWQLWWLSPAPFLRHASPPCCLSSAVWSACGRIGHDT